MKSICNRENNTGNNKFHSYQKYTYHVYRTRMDAFKDACQTVNFEYLLSLFNIRDQQG